MKDREILEGIFNKHLEDIDIYYKDISELNYLRKQIMKVAFEVLEKFELKRKKLPVYIYCEDPTDCEGWWVVVPDLDLDVFKTKEEAKAFCEEYSLEIVEE